MSVVSNLYAAKLYSEHPIAIWPLDDDVSYISLINNQQRKFQSASAYAGWTITNGTANDSLLFPDDASPFNSSKYAGTSASSLYAGIQGSVTASVAGTIIQAKSPDLFLFNSCNQDLETFCISMYVYQTSNRIDYYELGYEYYDNDTSSWIEVTTIFDALDRSGWIHLQDTFVIQEFDAQYCHVIFKAVSLAGGTSGDYNFIINGITVGQWSENFTSESLGATSASSLASASVPFNACSADQYGILSDNAYYLVQNGKLLAKNEGVPMIYGSENVTRLYHPSATASANPSIIFPNKRMFTEDGKYKNYTLETWIRLRPTTKESRKIIGPIDTNDGVYVQEGFITLVINKTFISHNISEWYRPMLLHVVVKDETVSMFINGEQVGQLEIDSVNTNFSNAQWIGFYTYYDFEIFEIDCVSIFPYAVPLQVATKRFVWGQGTDPVELVNDSFDGEEASIQFVNAKYNVNYIYPDKERWDAAYYNNLIATTNSISVPQYSLPEINIGGRDITEWYEDNKDLNDLLYPSNSHPLFFTFRPNIESSVWQPVTGSNWTEQSYLLFPTLSFLASPLSAIYGVFEVEQNINQSRPLIHIVNTLTNKRFEININGYNVTYRFDGQELVGTGYTVDNTHFVVGFHIPTLIENFSQELSSFFGSPEILQMLVGGDGTTTFESKIYRIGFSDQLNFNTISDYFDSNTGIVHYHLSVSAATTASVNLSSPPATIDGVTLTNNMRVLVKNQSTTSQNGIYRFDGSSLVRSTDYNSASAINAGDFFFVSGGTTNQRTTWVQTETVENLGSDPILFERFDNLFEQHYASYTLSPFFRYNTYFLDISVYAQWEEYFPLSSFASYITTRDGSRVYDLDYLQVNYGYPSLIQIVSSSVDNANWNYQQLFEAYNDPIQKSYEILDNELLSGYANYAALASNIITEYQIDTTGSSMDAYVTFQLLAEGADEPLSSFTYTKLLNDSYTVYAEEENTNANPYKAYLTKFPIIDGTIVYPPKKIDFKDVAMVIHFIIQQDGIISNPLKIRNLEVTSRCLNQNQLTAIGTRSGTPIYPYVKTGIYYSGKSKNPVIIGKNSLPYLYLTEKTGVKILEDDAEIEYGVIVPINLSESTTYSLGAVQMFLKYDVTHPIGTPMPIFNLIHQDGTIEFVLVPDETAERFYIYARDQISKQRYQNIQFYLNGMPVIEPHVMNKEWNVLSFSFLVPLDFSNYSGSINLLHGCWFDNVSFFKSSGLNEFIVIIPKIWSDILNEVEIINAVGDGTNVTYTTSVPHNLSAGQYISVSGINPSGLNTASASLSSVASIVNPSAFTVANTSSASYVSGGYVRYLWKEYEDQQWQDVYTLQETSQFSISPKEIYAAYTGTNIIVMDDNTGMSIENDDFTMFADQTWLSIVQKPA